MKVGDPCSWTERANPIHTETRCHLPGLEAGTVFGEVAFGTDEPRTATREARSDTKLLPGACDELRPIAHHRRDSKLGGFDASVLEML